MSGDFPKTVEDIFKDYKGRRDGLLMALTEESDDLYSKCDPERDNLCLYGEPDGTWMVDLPSEEVPPEMPEPVLGINFARDGMAKKDWLALVAVHSDAWLMSIAFYFAAKLDSAGRQRIFNRINELQSLYEIVQGKPKVKPNKSASKKRKSAEAEPVAPEPAPEPVAVAPCPIFPHDSTQRPHSSEFPQPTGRLLTNADISNKLKGKQAELFWPDDNLWYWVHIFSVDVKGRKATILYPENEVEELNLDEIIKEGHMSLLK